MAKPVLILGSSGVGKSASLRKFKDSEVFLINLAVFFSVVLLVSVILLIFLNRNTTSRRLGKSIAVIPTSLMNTLKNYPWPGNVRELENVIERAAINSSGPKLRLAEALKSPQQDLSTSLKTMKKMEFDYIVQILEHTDWKISGKHSAAEILGLKRGTLIARMKKLGIRKP